MPQNKLLLRKNLSDTGDAAMGYCYERFLLSSLEDLKDPKFYRALIAECIGTAVLVMLGCSAVAATGGDLVGISLCFGLAVASIVSIFANVSGGHMNPAVTFGMLIARKCSLIRCLLYVIAQCSGAFIGALLTQVLTCRWQLASHSDKCELGITKLGVGVTFEQGLTVEILITFILVFVVFAACDTERASRKGSGPLAIGLSVTLCHLSAIPLTGASMNTARSFGPAFLTKDWENHWVYWTGPLVGGLLASLLYDLVFAGDASISKAVSWLKSPSHGIMQLSHEPLHRHCCHRSKSRC